MTRTPIISSVHRQMAHVARLAGLKLAQAMKAIEQTMRKGKS